jgi:hypothetical protein
LDLANGRHCLAAPSVDLNLVVCGLAKDHSEKIANPKPLRSDPVSKVRPNDCT